MQKYSRHYEDIVSIMASPEAIFSYTDDQTNLSSHMNQSTWMMGGGSMKTELDEGGGKKVGSHIRMNGIVFGIHLFLEEVIIQREPPFRKAWETVGNINLIVIDHYKLGYEIMPMGSVSNLRIYIEYNLPKSWKTSWLGFIFGGIYARWCVRQMINGVQDHFHTNT